MLFSGPYEQLTSIYNMSGSDDYPIQSEHAQLTLFVLFIRMEITYSLWMLSYSAGYTQCLILNP